MRKPGKDCNNSRKYMRDVARMFYEDLQVTDVKYTYPIIACDQMCSKKVQIPILPSQESYCIKLMIQV